MSEPFNLDRDTNLKARIDPTGRKWEVHGKRGSSLYHARPSPDREDAVIPQLFAGDWTKVDLLLEKIDLYLVRAWDDSDRKAEEARRTKEAAIEQAALREEENKAAVALGCADEPAIEVATEDAKEVPDVAEDMSSEDKEAAILRAVAAENAAIAEAKGKDAFGPATGAAAAQE